VHLNPGEVVWGYEVLGTAESCGFRESYKVRNLRLNRLEVLKVLPPLPSRKSREWELSSHILREAEILCRLTHPNIVSVYDVFIADEYLLMALEYIDGTTLSHLRQYTPFSVPDSVRLTWQVLSGLEKAHLNSVVHRGLSPESIVVTDMKLAKLASFVFGRMPSFEEITHRGELVGYVHYTAPEQIQNPSKADGRADLYSAAAVLYELLTGHPPFLGPDPSTVMQGHLHRRPKPPAALAGDVPERLSRVVLKALEKNPADRYQTAGEFRMDLEEFCPQEFFGSGDGTSSRLEIKAYTGPHGCGSHSTGGMP